MKLEDHIVAWNHASVKVLDIRHTVIEPGDKLQGYILPACGFIYCVRGTASLNLNGIDYDADPHFIVHGGKGMRLSIEAGEMFEYYLLFYRASLPGRKDLARLLERSNPFRMQYGFESLEPLPLYYQLMAMEQLWEQGSLLEKIQVKGLFYQFVHELLKQFTKDGINLRQPDVIGQVVRYIEEHYRHNLSLESIAEQFNYSPGHLSTRFKGETGFSLIEYLIRFRLQHAEELLQCTEAPLRDIAKEVGYSDVYYFSRVFRKYNGQSPIRFRKESRKMSLSENRPFTATRFSIGENIPSRYNVIEYDNHYHNNLIGGSSSMRITKTSSFIVAMLLSFTLILSACGSANVGSNATNSNGSKASEVTSSTTNNSTDSTNKEAQTRTISTPKGDIVVTANPERVVALYLQGDLIALGIKPVGTSDVFEGAAFAEVMDGIESLGTWFEPNPEAVMALKPDLIIVPSEETYDKLKDIAPTVYIPYDILATDERVMKVGEVFGKEQEAQAILDHFHEKVENSKQKLAELGILNKTVTIIEGGKKEMALIDSKLYGRGSQIIYEYLGLEAPEIIQKKIDGREQSTGGFISMEVLPEYIGDFVFRSVWEGADDLSGNPIWNSIPAVKEGRLIEIDFDFSYYSDIYSLDKQLDFVVESLVSAYDKK
ncbi:AraC family transcriptional regulator [Paenibacillus endoradicis]|uniref:AraC family transcriptional regulator n=1 Tax=Paenibacillus endoradicis TaxID=2972487 RepID=UPI00215920A6|nr:AraC family transcriptional regulator [Paenibacillus endoradicis]MCR8659893.1 AraC family transcriptional regulator [Paenibacillus endoradicis]